MFIKSRWIRLFWIGLAVLLLLPTGLILAKETPFPTAQTGVETGFTYQGQLTAGSDPAEGIFDFQFDLYDAETGGTLLGTAAKEDVTVTGGIFTVTIDFGSGAFDGSARWLAISVRPGAETGAYTPSPPAST